MYQINIKVISDISLKHLEKVIKLMAQQPEFSSQYSEYELKQRLSPNDNENLLLLAYVEDELAGFKLGYALDQYRFYSWLGGVLPDFRGLGLAKELLKAQERWAKSIGYTRIQVKIHNEFRSVLSLLVSQGYQMIDFTPVAEDISQHRLTLQKQMHV